MPDLTASDAISDDQVRSFARDGYVVLRGLVPSDVTRKAKEAIDRNLAAAGPPAGHVGYFFPTMDSTEQIFELLHRTAILRAAERLIGRGELDVSKDAQVALNYPFFDHVPGGGHLDGWNPPEKRWTFTLLVGVLLSDQEAPNMGNLWLWPGTHLQHQEFFREHGPESMLTIPWNSPPIKLPQAEQFLGKTGDVILAHYLLAHNIGGNTSDRARYAAYFRIRRTGHDDRWRETMLDAWLEYDGVRDLLEAPAPGTTAGRRTPGRR